jgi:isoleucyl-tRNA synthetase
MISTVYVDDEKTEVGHRIPDVFDCWIESGSMPFASQHYPFEGKDTFESRYPAQYIVEYIAQTRAWFYTLHVMSVALFGKPAFENAVTTGTILAEDGSKMSKSKKNYPDPNFLINKYGVDSLRLYLMSSVVMKADNLSFSENGVDDIRKNVMNIWWNIFVFYQSYVPQSTLISPLPPLISNPLDRWLVSKINGLTKLVTNSMDNYDVVTASRALMSFAKEFSTWYLRLSRERLHENQESQSVFGYALTQYTLLMSPFAPFMAERIYQNLPQATDSVHLQAWPVCSEQLLAPDLEADMEKVMQIVEKGHAARKASNIRLRQPLSRLTISLDFSSELKKLIMEELNVKDIAVVINDQLQVSLDTTLTPELQDEGKMRDLIRDIQGLRKKQGLAQTDFINVITPAYPLQFRQEIINKVGAKSLEIGDTLLVTKV